MHFLSVFKTEKVEILLLILKISKIVPLTSKNNKFKLKKITLGFKFNKMLSPAHFI